MSHHDDRSIRVLFVEADSRFQPTAASLRAEPSFSVAQVSRLDDALRLLATDSFDVVLTDLTLPDENGIDVVRRLRDTSPVTPIVLFADGTDELRAEARALGVGSFVEKLHDPKDVVRQLAAAFEHAICERRFRDIVANNADASVVVDAQGIVLYANRAAETLFAFKTDMTGTKFPFPFGGSASQEILIDPDSPRPRIGEMRVVELPTSGSNWHESTPNDSPDQYRDRTVFLASIRDITERRRRNDLKLALEASEREAALGVLARRVSRELGRPIAALKANNHALTTELNDLERALQTARSRLSSELGDKATAIFDQTLGSQSTNSRSTRRLLDRIHALIADSGTATKRGEAIATQLSGAPVHVQKSLERCDLNDLIRVACGIVDSEILTTARLHVELAVLPQAMVNRAGMVGAFVSLLLRAARSVAARGGKGEIHIVSRRLVDERRGEAVEVEIKDTGLGLGRLRAERIFDAEVTNGRAPVVSSLALAADTVRRHHGTISCASELGVGSCFTIRLPLEATPAKVRTVRPAANDVGDRLTILLIEEEPLLRRSMRRILAPHTVLEATSAEAARKQLTRGDLDAIVSNLTTPGLDGPTLLTILAAERPELIPNVVFATAGRIDDRLGDFILEAQPLLLEKPIERRTLLATLASLSRPKVAKPAVVDRAPSTARDDVTYPLEVELNLSS